MASQIIYLSILPFVFFNPSAAQTGEGCAFTTCITPGQVRINAIYDANHNFIGGCNCGCDLALGDPSSPIYCAPPNIVNIDPYTQRGDCSCYNPHELGAPNPNTITDPPLNTEAIPQGIIPAPQIPDYGLPTATSEVLCTEPGVCECPIGHKGHCIITCDGADACVEQDINCNNNGFDCTVNCVSETACEGATVINGPLHGSLTVNCVGEFACEGGTLFNGAQGKDLTVACDSPTACGDSIFQFGFGRGLVACNGDPESCMGAVFELYPNARNTVGVAFACMGLFCPFEAPKPFSNAYGPVTQTCSSPGNCACPPATNGECILNCAGSPDACKDGLLECNNGGHPCTVNCAAPQGCAGATTVTGPIGSALTVNCKGEKACEGAAVFNGQHGTDMIVVCGGREACKGAPTFNFGSGIGRVECNGLPDACRGAEAFNVPSNAQAFACTGRSCPPAAPSAFNNPPVPIVEAGPIVIGPNVNVNIPQTVSDHCCSPSIPGFKQWRGTCWLHTDEPGCYTEQGRCVWDLTGCLPRAPVCLMAEEICTSNSECCSEMCILTVPTADGECM